MSTLLSDLRYGLRMLAKNPGFTAVAVLTLALGIGANTAIFSVLDATLLRPLPYRDPGRLVWITEFAPRMKGNIVPSPTYLTWRARNQVFDGMEAYVDHICDANLTGGAGSVRMNHCAAVSAGFFSLLGVQPARGRGFLPEEDRPRGRRVLIISDSFWRQHLGADPAILGKTLTLDDKGYTVVGVMPAGFRYPSGLAPAVLLPLGLPAQPDWSARKLLLVDVVARLKPGTTLARAESDLTAMNGPIAREYPQPFAAMLARARPSAVPLHDHLVGDVRPMLLVFLGAVVFVLLIACANVANLLLARAATRQNEIALRAALGAGRAQLMRQMLIEGVLVGGGGALAALLVADWSLVALRRLAPQGLPDIKAVGINAAALAFTLALGIVTGLLFSLVPAWVASNPDVNAILKEAGAKATEGRRRHRARNALVTAELALSLVLLIGAGLLLKGFVRLLRVDPGFDPHHLLVMQVTLSETRHSTPVQQRAFFDDLLDRVKVLPGVQAAATVTDVPPDEPYLAGLVTVEGQTEAPGSRPPSVPILIASADYFRAMGMRLAAGRFFTAADDDTAPGVVVINREFARRFLPSQNPLGRRLQFSVRGKEGQQEVTIVGVVADLHQQGLDREITPQVFAPFLQFPVAYSKLVIKTAFDPLTLADAVRKQVLAVDPRQPVYEVGSMEERLGQSIGARRFSMALVVAFAFLALALAAIGIYSVVSYSVGRRTHEIGIRMALGARRQDVLRLVVGQGAVLTLGGIAAGLAGAALLTPFLSTLLYGVTAGDPATWATVSCILAAVALAASYIPARRATKVDPMVALRCE